VYPTFKGLSVDSIMAVVLADPKVRVVGDYICYSSEVTQLEAVGGRKVIKGDLQNVMPDIDFFMPLAGLKLNPMPISDQDDVSITKMIEIVMHLSTKAPLYMYSLLKGTLHPAITEHYFGNIDVKFMLGALAVVATGPKCNQFITR
jgi:hypothetical protein